MDSIPEITSIESDFKDRSTGLIIFGVFTIMLGCLAGLFVLMMLGMVASAGRTNASPPPSSLLPAVLIYLALAVFLIWTGIGSIRARRWARALLLIFSWAWLVIGIFMTICIPLFMAKVFANLPADSVKGQAALPPAAVTGMVIFLLMVFGFFFVLLPAIWTFFYMSRHVKATCERRDTIVRWTDACPLPVLGLCLWLLFSVPMLLMMPVIAHGVIPLFGIFLSGLAGSLFCVSMAALWAYAAWLLYKLDARGWWITVIAMVLYMVSSLLTFARHDILEMYQRMGYPQGQIDQMQKFGFLTGNGMEWMMAIFFVPFFGYLLFVKKYFGERVP